MPLLVTVGNYNNTDYFAIYHLLFNKDN